MPRLWKPCSAARPRPQSWKADVSAMTPATTRGVLVTDPGLADTRTAERPRRQGYDVSITHVSDRPTSRTPTCHYRHRCSQVTGRLDRVAGQYADNPSASSSTRPRPVSAQLRSTTLSTTVSPPYDALIVATGIQFRRLPAPPVAGAHVSPRARRLSTTSNRTSDTPARHRATCRSGTHRKLKFTRAALATGSTPICGVLNRLRPSQRV